MLNNKYNYRLAEIKDLNKIAKIHITEFSDYFLTIFGEKLVENFYESYLNSNQILIVAENYEKDIVGFILGTNSSMAREKFFKQNFYALSFVIFKELIKGNKILWYGIWKRIFFIKESILSKFFSSKNMGKRKLKEKWDILSIAVKKEQRGEKVAYNIEKFFCEELKKRNIKEVGLSVKTSNSRAISFYKKCDYKIKTESPNMVYFIKNI